MTRKYPVRVTNARREDLAKLANNIGIWNLDKKALAKQYGISLNQVYADLKVVRKMVSLPELEDISLNIGTGYKKAIMQCMADIVRGDEKNRHTAIRTFNEVSKGFTEFLEAWGLKKKVADELNILGKSMNVVFHFSDNEYPELKEYKGLRAKPEANKSTAEEISGKQ